MKPLLPLLFLLVTAAAQAYRFIEDSEPAAPQVQEGAKWKEGKVALPPYPSETDLMPLHLDAPQGYRYYVDRAHLRVDPDQVVRYTLVIEPRPGVRNLSFEGIRCDVPAYKRYGYGDAQGHIRPMPPGEWTRLWMGASGYQRQFHDRYFCRTGAYLPYSREEILRRIQTNRPDLDPTLLP